ncbi:MAG: hypoxanthine phosphoribosyltransferase [Acidobacteria bacterium]|nr:hypoxanthine phosphoribosyltransferase [Acidobacteriota bacterium]
MNSERGGSDLEVLLDGEAIARRVRELGAQISADYRGRPLRLVGVLKGAWIFLADLVRCLDIEVTVDFLSFASYGDGAESTGAVKITKDLDHAITGLDVLVVEDILDTGRTFESLLGVLEAHKPRSIKVVTLLDKPSRRIQPVNADYVGFTIPDAFVVGYGLDYAGKYRNLPDVRIVRNPSS